MTQKEEITKQEKQVVKIIKSHGFGFNVIDYTLHSILVLKAMQSGINNPSQWACQQIENLNNQK